jgi:hypothetical protein
MVKISRYRPKVFTWRKNAPSVVDAMTLREAQGIRLKAQGKSIIQLKLPRALRLSPLAVSRYPLEKNGHGRNRWRCK